MSLNFEKHAQKGNELLNHLTQELRITDTGKAGRILRAVLRALRNRLSTEESMQFIAQLPMVLKAVYIDGWNISKEFERIKHVEEFIDEVMWEDRNAAFYDFQNDEEARFAIGAVFRTLARYVSEGELEDVLAVMPKELKAFLKDCLTASSEK